MISILDSSMLFSLFLTNLISSGLLIITGVFGVIFGSLISAGLCECIYGIQPEQPERTQYRIPRATENPAVHRGMLRRWIKNFHEMNGMKLPKGFYERDKRQLRGMYYGMLEEYDISIEDIIRSRH